MSKSKKAISNDVRPLFKVTVECAKEVHAAIASGKLPLNIAPVNIEALERWAHENLQDDSHEHGLFITKTKEAV